MNDRSDKRRTIRSEKDYRDYMYSRYSAFENTADYQSVCRKNGLDPNKHCLDNLDVFAARCGFGMENSSDNCGGERLGQQNEFFRMLLQPFHISATEQSAMDSDVINGISGFYAERMKNYNPAYSFAKHFMYITPYCIIDSYRKDNGMVRMTEKDWEIIERSETPSLVEKDSERKRTYGRMTVSLDTPIGEDNRDADTLGDMIPDEKADEDSMMSRIYMAEIGARAAAALLNLDCQPLSRKSNSVRRNYFHLIFTDRIVYSVRNIHEACRTFERHEREILKPMKPLFLPFTLELELHLPELDERFLASDGNYCHLRQICEAPVRCGKEVFPNGTDEPLEEPFPADVMIAYLERKEGVRSSREQISQNVRYYTEYMSAFWKEAEE